MNMPLWIGFDLDFFLWTLAWAREPLEYFTPHRPSYLRGRITWPVEGWDEEWKNDWGRYLKKVTMWSNQYIKSEYRRSVELASERAQGCSVCIRASNLPADSDTPPPKHDEKSSSLPPKNRSHGFPSFASPSRRWCKLPSQFLFVVPEELQVDRAGIHEI